MKNRDTKFLIILVVLMILNIVDALATAFWIDNNLASEANPLMETWLNFSHTFFITMKIFLVDFTPSKIDLLSDSTCSGNLFVGLPKTCKYSFKCIFIIDIIRL